MREILFRGKCRNGEWIHGSIIQVRGDRVTITEDNKSFIWYYDVTPETFGQYTGLKDRNGMKIFEGDILRVTDCYPGMHDMETGRRTFIGAVEFENGSFVIREPGSTTTHYCWMDYETEIIGNIFDNPELMEGGREHEDKGH